MGTWAFAAVWTRPSALFNGLSARGRCLSFVNPFTSVPSHSTLRRSISTGRPSGTRAMPPVAAAASPSTSYKSVTLSPNVEIFIRPVRQDNFSYLIWDREANVCAAVDPFSPKGMVDLANDLGAKLTTILCTHHHNDHSGGNEEIAKLVPGIDVVGSQYETAPGVTIAMGHDEKRVIRGGSLLVRALRTPCHTMGHLCFVVESGKTAAFTGDTLFVGGCGRFFEGEGKDMEYSLNTVLSALPDECLVFCGHEYTLSNLRFAVDVDKDNTYSKKKLAWAEDVRSKGEHTIPSTIGAEKLHNPFMRTADPALAAALGVEGQPPAMVMRALREAKNNF